MLKKIFCICLTLSIIFSFSNVLAYDKESTFNEDELLNYKEFNKMKSNDTIQMDSNHQGKDDKLTQDELKSILKKFSLRFNNNRSNFTLQKQKKSLELLNKIQINLSKNDSDYDENKAKLRAGNFIESILDLDEGLTELEIFLIGFTYANKARDEAEEKYPDDIMLGDAFRHFIWNNMSAKGVGIYPTRTVTINHEWGILMLNPMLKYFDEQYETYDNQGYDNAGTKALADVISYIPIFKEYAITVCKDKNNGYTFFKSFFNDSNIMDLHNNCWGRAYASTNSSLTYEEAFDNATSRDELILDEDDVSSYNFKYVYDNEWYTY